MNLFQKAKALFNRVVARALIKGVDSSRLTAGKAIVHSRNRDMPWGEWLQRWLVDLGAKQFENGFAAPTKRNPRAGYQRRRSTVSKRRGPNYDRVNRELAKFNGEPARTVSKRPELAAPYGVHV